MTVDEFRGTLDKAEPARLSLALRALWWAARGDWDHAHASINDSDDPDCMWVHAHLHRQEGDFSNARYWYSRAQKAEFKGSIDDEWDAIAAELLTRAG